MKKILYILFASAVMILTASCTDDSSSNDGKSAVTFSLSGIATRADDAANSTNSEQALIDAVMPKLSFRVYSIINKKETFIRMYSGDEVKDKQIWLIPGKYKVVVDGGDQSPATFERSEVYYHGEKEFTIENGANNHKVVVQCYPQNVMIKIRYDKSVKDLVASGGLTGVSTLVAVTGNVEEIGSSASLSYDLSIEDVLNDEGVATGEKILKEPTVGYYTFSDEQKSIIWKFQATDTNKNDKKIEKQNVYTPKDPTTNEPIGFKPGYVYTLTLKYSPDLGGYISLQVSASKNETAYDDIIQFRPAPQFSGTYVNKTVAVYKDMDGGLEYMVKAINPMESIEVYIGKDEDNNGEEDIITAGVTINEVNEKEWKLTLGEEFIEQLAAGVKDFRVVAKDANGVETEYVQSYKGEGAYEMEVTSAWFGQAKLSAYVNNKSVNNASIFYRKKGAADWSSTALTIANGIGSAEIEGVIGNAAYEFYLSYGGDEQTKPQIGPTKEETEATIAKIIPNGNMETWTEIKEGNNTVLVPYQSTVFWDCGNHGSATLGKNVTENKNDNKEGSWSAYLDSQYVGIGGSLGKFAAGNIYVGTYLGTNGTNGAIGYGQPFNFDFKPTKLTVWYRGNVGEINNTGSNAPDNIKSGSDKSQIFVWLCNREKQYVVYTGNTGTFINADGTYANKLDSTYSGYENSVPAHEKGAPVEGIVAWGSWSRTQGGVSINGGNETTYSNGTEWTKIEIPLQYKDGVTEIPNFLVISCAASAYGDYFTGSTDSYMYVDDFKFGYDN